MTTFTHWWHSVSAAWSGLKQAESTAYSRGWMEGFTAGLNTSVARAGGERFMAGFIEGRESTRSVPLESLAPESGKDATCHTH